MFSVAFLNELRRAEFEAVSDLFPAGQRVLEVGAGTGQQALLLTEAGHTATAIDLDVSNYAADRVFPVIDYDGKTFPFPDRSFDVVFSSNVLEHVLDLPQLHRESKRVLGAGGVCIHIMPTHTWRFWTSVSAFPAIVQAVSQAVGSPGRGAFRRVLVRIYVAVRQPRHGERGNALTELWTFSPAWWRRHFKDNGFEIVSERPIGIFYSGESVLGKRLSVVNRKTWAKWLGSSCYVFKVKPADNALT